MDRAGPFVRFVQKGPSSLHFRLVVFSNQRAEKSFGSFGRTCGVIVMGYDAEV
jgi:hypothetical protein